MLKHKQLRRLLGASIPKKAKVSWVYAFILGVLVGVGYIDYDKRTWYTRSTVGKISLCFTPPSGCGELIAREISHARESLFLQAYSFTSIKIIEQIIEAKYRGVKINVLLDRSNLHDSYSKMGMLESAGIKVNIDRASGIAHNKVIVIDRQKVITGSFNFTRDADKRNVENVVFIDDSQIAQQYISNWYKRYNNFKI